MCSGCLATRAWRNNPGNGPGRRALPRTDARDRQTGTSLDPALHPQLPTFATELCRRNPGWICSLWIHGNTCSGLTAGEFPPVLKAAPGLWPRQLRVRSPCGSHPKSTEFFQALAKPAAHSATGKRPRHRLPPAELRPRLLLQISTHLWFPNVIWVRGRATLLPIHGQVLSASLMCKIYFGCRVQPPFLGSNSVSNIPPTKQAFLFLFWFFSLS